MNEEFVDVNALERRFGLSTSWWYAQAEANRIPSYKVGKYRKFLVSEIAAHFDTLRSGPRVERSR